MQDQSKLNLADLELIQTASKHAKERFQKDRVSIAGALRAKDSKIYTGINLKYRVRNVSACAETMAIYAALNDGQSKLDTIVGVKYSPETDSFTVVNPCGSCRQLYCYNTPLRVIIDASGTLHAAEVETLLPYAFL